MNYQETFNLTQMKKIKKAENYRSKLIDDLLNEISPGEQKMTDRKMLLAARIADAMKEKGLRKTDLSKALGVQPSVVTKWLSGTHNFTSETLWKIGDVLEMDLIKLEDEPEEQITYHATLEIDQQVVNENMSKYFIKNVHTVGDRQELSTLKNY